MKKKMYEQPKMEVVEIDQTDIICTSGDPEFGFPLGGTGYDEDQW